MGKGEGHEDPGTGVRSLISEEHYHMLLEAQIPEMFLRVMRADGVLSRVQIARVELRSQPLIPAENAYVQITGAQRRAADDSLEPVGHSGMGPV